MVENGILDLSRQFEPVPLDARSRIPLASVSSFQFTCKPVSLQLTSL